VASSKSRSFVMMVLGPRKILATRLGNKEDSATRSVNELWRSTKSVRLDCGVVQTRTCIYFRRHKVTMRPCSLRIQTIIIVVLPLSLAAIRCTLARIHLRSGYIPASVAGELGPCGPRTGSSSGVWPGNSSGRGGSPGSCIGGGTSGRGLPGGLSCGGSDGCPGLIGGSSRGSIGIYSAGLRLSPKSARAPVMAVAAILT
jgi:hypothetical protein